MGKNQVWISVHETRDARKLENKLNWTLKYNQQTFEMHSPPYFLCMLSILSLRETS
jgi:hypothetical protein